MGHVTVRYGSNDDPQHWGMEYLSLPVDLDRARGFPVLLADIDYSGAGYAGMMGWIQILDIRSHTSGKHIRLLDRFSAFERTGSPFNTFGHLPALFDAPVIDALPESVVSGRAQSFLAAIPDVGASRKVVALCGFEWGFDVEHQTPAPLPPQPIGEAAWQEAVPFLKEQCADWEFLSRAGMP